MSIDLKGQRVLVVGASGGIGEAAVRLFAAQGAHVVAAARSIEKLAALVADTGAEAASLDVLENAAVEAFFAGMAPFDHVVVAAAATKSGPVASLALDDAKAAMESKFWGAYRIARAAALAEGGSLTFVSGFLSHRPSATAGLQGAINAALESLARGLALEKAPTRVNTVSPGLIDTPLWHGIAEADRNDMFARTAARLPVRRIGHAQDVAQAILFLATNPFATGTTVTVDGGGTIA